MTETDPTGEMYLVADELRSIAELGLHYADNDYDRERYRRALSLSAQLVAAIEKRPADDVVKEYEGSLRHATPYRRRRCGRVPGWAHAPDQARGQRPLGDAGRRDRGRRDVGAVGGAGASRRGGVEGTATKLLGVFDLRLWGSRVKFHVYCSVWLVELHDGQTPVAGPETTGVGFFAEDDLPDLSPGHARRVPLVFELARGDVPAPYFDPTERE